MRKPRIIVGVGAWICLFAAAVSLVDAAGGGRVAAWTRQIFQFEFRPRHTVAVQSARVQPAAGDPIFMIDAQGQFRMVGEFRSSGQAEFYSNLPIRDIANAELRCHSSDASLAWLVQTVLPPAKRQAVLEEIATAIQAKRSKLLEALEPAISAGIARIAPDLEKALLQAIKDHQLEIDRLATIWIDDARRNDIDQLVQDVCWPILRQNAAPLANEIGGEIWERVSLWRFGWRLLYDKTPLGGDAVQQEWERFAREEIMPILERRTSDFMTVAALSARQSAADPRIQRAVGEELERLLRDPAFQSLAAAIIKQSMLDNPTVHQAIAAAFQTPQARQAAESLAQELEPTLARVANMIFGDLDSGVTPEFARALRAYVLGKDRRWFLLEANKPVASPSRLPTELMVRPADTAQPYPLSFVVGAAK